MQVQGIFKKRIEKMQEELKNNNLDMVLFTDRENLIYYTGLTNIECMALIIPAQGEPVSITLWLDVPYMRKYSAISNVKGYVFPASNLGAKVVEVIKEMGYSEPTIGFGKYFVEFSVYDALRNGLPGSKFVNATVSSYKVRAVKDEQEITLIKKASEIVIKGMEAAIDSVKPGMTEVQVLAEAEYAMRKAGSEGSTFRMQVLAGERQLLTHPYAGDNIIENNQSVVIHLGASYKGYVSKMARTIALGDVHPEIRKIYEVLVEAQQAGVKAVKPLVSVKDIYSATFQVIDNAGYGKYFLDDLGHGVGIRQSEFYPIIGRTREFTLEENMVIDLMFPTIYKPGVGGSRVTDTMLVTKDGAEIFTEFTYEMIQK
ncbi:MAG: Xaa-Pro dipeptidase [Clostridia bacterium]|nr:Xaa-Pro dipeptidase [Clostridia bacterium]